MRYLSQKQIENLPEIVKSGTTFGEVAEYTLDRDMPKDRFVGLLSILNYVKKFYEEQN